MNEEPAAESRFGGDIFELQEEFALHDLDGDGRLSLHELQALLDGLESGLSPAEIRLGFAEIDSDHDRYISCKEFIAWWTSD
jgi:Ca2+-binding EF-hand superfamily protein